MDVFDLGDLPSGERFMIMEYIEGESLMARLRTRDRLPAVEAARMVVQLLEGLAKVHEAGIIHRDLKPANVLLARTESGGDFVKILDFGICKVLQDRNPGEVSTDVGDVMGTPSYMSPEQLEHGPKGLDARADLYAVGVILYRCLSGRLPYPAKNLVELLFKLREGKVDPIQEVADVDEGFAKIVNRAIEWDRDARNQSARDFQAALSDWLSASTRLERLLTEFLDVAPVEHAVPKTAPPARRPPCPFPRPRRRPRSCRAHRLRRRGNRRDAPRRRRRRMRRRRTFARPNRTCGARLQRSPTTG